MGRRIEKNFRLVCLVVVMLFVGVIVYQVYQGQHIAQCDICGEIITDWMDWQISRRHSSLEGYVNAVIGEGNTIGGPSQYALCPQCSEGVVNAIRDLRNSPVQEKPDGG